MTGGAAAAARLVQPQTRPATGTRAHRRRAVSGTDLAGAVAGRGEMVGVAIWKRQHIHRHASATCIVAMGGVMLVKRIGHHQFKV